jgi:uncharacterized protein (DUF2141 family)
MYKNFLIILGMALVVSLQSFTTQDGFTLKVKVYDLKNSDGQAVIMLYNKDGSIPDKTFTHFYKKKVVKIDNKTAYVEFYNIPKGKYAINFFHDENSNNKLDKGWMVPKEGFGLSNFKKVSLFNKPNFKRASFMLNQDKLVKIKTIYM